MRLLSGQARVTACYFVLAGLCASSSGKSVSTSSGTVVTIDYMSSLSTRKHCSLLPILLLDSVGPLLLVLLHCQDIFLPMFQEMLPFVIHHTMLCSMLPPCAALPPLSMLCQPVILCEAAFVFPFLSNLPTWEAGHTQHPDRFGPFHFLLGCCATPPGLLVVNLHSIRRQPLAGHQRTHVSTGANS